MKLLFKQRFFSWFDSYDIYDENGNVAFEVQGKLAWGHKLVIYDAYGREVGMIQERIFTLLPKFELYAGGNYLGCMSKEFSFFHPRYNLEHNGWHVEGGIMEWDYTIYDARGTAIAEITKELFNWTDTYVIDISNPDDALNALMFVLAIDAEKCSRSNN